MKTIQVEIKSVYGVEKIYPVSEEAKVFAKLLGQQTLTVEDIQNIKLLGYMVEVVSTKPKTL